MESLLSQFRQFAEGAGEDARQQAIDLLENLARDLRGPNQLFQHLQGLQLELTTAKIAVDLGLFKILAAGEGPMTVVALADKTKADANLMRRVLRQLAATRMIVETGKDEFAATATTRTLATDGFNGSIIHFHDTTGPAIQATPLFLQKSHYAEPNSFTNSPFQVAHNTPLPAFSYLPTEQPALWTALQQAMQTWRPATRWFDAFPFLATLGDWPAHQPALVDVGGGIGAQLAELLKAFPAELGGRLILQDLKQTIEGPALKTMGVRNMVQDFFEGQPVTDAKFYYMCGILHDWADDKCEAILRTQRSAMAPGARVLIHEYVMPDTGAHWEATTMDINMLANLSAKERTRGQWEDLLGAAGFEIEQIHTYGKRQPTSIIIAAPKED